MTAILQIIFDALSLGSLYALGALGIALIFGVMRLVNFAHGDYISFCVFALLWPSIGGGGRSCSSALLPSYHPHAADPADRRWPLCALGNPGLPPFSQCQSGDHDDRLLRARLRHQALPADAVFEPAEIHRPVVAL